MNKEQFHIDFASTNEDLDEILEQELNKNNSRYYSLGNRKKNLPKYIKRLSKVIKNGEYDIVHINSNSATALIELKISQKYAVKKRIVHNHTSNCDYKMLHVLCLPFFRSAFTDAVACSKKAGSWIFGDGNFQILNNGIDTERYRFSTNSREQIRTQYNIKASTIVLGHVGKIYKPKNHHFLIDVFALYHNSNHDSKLLLVGDGIMRAEIEAKVAERGLTDAVLFVGMQRQPEKYLSAMDIFVFPSLWEGMPLSVIEAQASGVPCIVSDRIDGGVTVTDFVTKLSVDQGSQLWYEALMNIKIINRDKKSENSINMLRKAGYDADTNARELAKLYTR